MSTFDETGLTIDTTDEILDALETDEESTIDAGIDTSPEEPLGQLNGIHASQQEDALELLQAIFAAVDPNGAEGVQLDVIGAQSGSKRKPASSTVVLATLTTSGSPTFTPAVLDANGNVVTPGSIQAQVEGHPEFVFTNHPKNLTAAQLAAGSMYMICTQTGPVACNAGTLTVISPAVPGLTAITNAADGIRGANVETDAAFRIRREQELVPAGGGTADSMRQSLLAVAGTGPDNQGVIQALVLENDEPTSQVVSGVTLPPNCFACVIWDGSSPQAANNDIAAAIWGAKPAGIKAYDLGSGVSGTVVDSSGTTRTIGFARATQLSMYINITVAVDSTFDTVNGPAALQALLATYGNTLVQGQSVVPLDFTGLARWGNAAAGIQPVQGVRNVTVFQVDSHASPTNTAEISVTALQIARFDTSRIIVTTTPFS